jgi:hypothetical protein
MLINDSLIGKRIRLLRMPDDPHPIIPGSEGVVKNVVTWPGSAQIWVRWDSGRGLALAVPPDQFEVIQ